MLSGSSFLDKMLHIKNWLAVRLETDHGQALDRQTFDIVWENYQLGDEKVGIATVMANEASKDDVQIAMLLLEPSGEKIRHRETHTLEAHSIIRFMPDEQTRRALTAQQRYLLSRRSLVMDGLGTNPQKFIPKLVTPEDNDESVNTLNIIDLLLTSEKIFIDGDGTAVPSPIVKIHEPGVRRFRLQYDVQDHFLVISNVENLIRLFNFWLEPWEIGGLQFSPAEMPLPTDLPIPQSQLPLDSSVARWAEAVSRINDSAQEQLELNEYIDLDEVAEAASRLHETFFGPLREPAPNLAAAAPAAIPDPPTNPVGLPPSELTNLIKEAVRGELDEVRDSIRNIVSNSGTYNRVIASMPGEIIDCLRADNPDGVLRKGEIEEVVREALKDAGTILQIPAVPQDLDATNPSSRMGEEVLRRSSARHGISHP
jgi:hypothetical protein